MQSWYTSSSNKIRTQQSADIHYISHDTLEEHRTIYGQIQYGGWVRQPKKEAAGRSTVYKLRAAPKDELSTLPQHNIGKQSTRELGWVNTGKMPVFFLILCGWNYQFCKIIVKFVSERTVRSTATFRLRTPWFAPVQLNQFSTQSLPGCLHI